MISNNPILDALARDVEEERWQKMLPICADCGEPITADFFINDGVVVCWDCQLSDEHLVDFDGYMDMQREEMA